MSKKSKLSRAQIDALDSFSMAGGHGFGEYANLSRSTAYSLARLGFVVLGSYWSGSRSRSVGYVTRAGVEALNASRPHMHQRLFHGAQFVMPGWRPWGTIPPAKRGGASLPQVATL